MNRRSFLLALGATPIAVALGPLIGRHLDAAKAVQVRPTPTVRVLPRSAADVALAQRTEDVLNAMWRTKFAALSITERSESGDLPYYRDLLR